VAGSLDLERALTEGRRAFEPGLLARAHRGVLYVDEVNLLGDHLVDLLLDAAAMGRNHVEREGVSVSHAARFQLVGTMNPEEGELRPQLLDRFGLTVEVRASRDLEDRAEVVRRRLAYEADPDGFAVGWAEADAAVAARIRGARKLLPEVVLGDGALRAVVAACAAFDVDGLRADLVTAKAATALAAWEGRTAVTVADVRAAALLALPHRRRRQPFEQPGLDEERLDEALDGLDGDDPDPGGGPGGPGAPGGSDGGPDGGTDAAPPGGQPEAGEPAAGDGRRDRDEGGTDPAAPGGLRDRGEGAADPASPGGHGAGGQRHRR
jgi:magnesium chelatase subunit D